MSISQASRILLPWRSLAFPVDWSEEFMSEAPVHLEVGFGDGRFTLRRAKEHPDQMFVGLEIASVSLHALLRYKRNLPFSICLRLNL